MRSSHFFKINLFGFNFDCFIRFVPPSLEYICQLKSSLIYFSEVGLLGVIFSDGQVAWEVRFPFEVFIKKIYVGELRDRKGNEGGLGHLHPKSCIKMFHLLRLY